MADTVMQMAQDQTPDPIGQGGINLFGPSPPLCEEYYRRAQAQISRRQRENPNIYKTGPTKYQDGANKGHWTPEEDE